MQNEKCRIVRRMRLRLTDRGSVVAILHFAFFILHFSFPQATTSMIGCPLEIIIGRPCASTTSLRGSVPMR
jgi:hypothetical protein